VQRLAAEEDLRAGWRMADDEFALLQSVWDSNAIVSRMRRYDDSDTKD